MAVPSNSALFEGIGGDFGYSPGQLEIAMDSFGEKSEKQISSSNIWSNWQMFW